MIPVTDEPMEGVTFDVQDHARRTCTIWTGTHGEMISSDLHGAEDPIRWMWRPHQGAEIGQILIRGLHLRGRGHSTRDTPTKLDLGGHFSGTLALKGLGHPHLHHDIIQLHGHFWRLTGQQWHMWLVGEALGGPTFCSWMLHWP
jgi:hypothetical protein